MFTGIVEEAGIVQSVTETDSGIRLQVRALLCGDDARLGDSIAVNGCCLTVVDIAKISGAKLLTFDLLRETWNRTNFNALQNRSCVNLERALAANGRLHGHFVTGHIDETGTIDVFEKRGADWFLRINTSPALLRYIVFKGSIAIDGISLTVAEVTTETVSVWIIPHTYQVTALRERKPGDLVNLEADLLAKYIEKLTPAWRLAGGLSS